MNLGPHLPRRCDMNKPLPRQIPVTIRRLVVLSLLLVAPRASQHGAASDPASGDWPMWGGTPDRNMVSTMKGLPTEWDIKSKKNVKWVAELGSQAYGNPVVANGV